MRLSNCRDGPGHQRLTMFSDVEASQPLSKRVVGAAFGLALRHEIAVLQQLSAVLLQKPLDRSGARLVWSHVDVADALCHALISPVLSPTKARETTFADRPRQSKHGRSSLGSDDRHKY